MGVISDYIKKADRQALRSIGLMLGALIIVIALIIYGRHFSGLTQSDIVEPLKQVRGSVWAFPLTVSVFILTAFLGVPQWGLIAVSVIVFGPLWGAIYAWGATLFSALTGFVFARYLGAKRLKAYGGKKMGRLAGFVRENGFGVSFLVRLVPSGPFVLVNMAAGLSGMSLPSFMLGTLLGIIPKIAVIALLGQGIDGAFTDQKGLLALVSFVLAGLCIIGMLWARGRLNGQIVTAGSREITRDKDHTPHELD